jgi:hypothetical protein
MKNENKYATYTGNKESYSDHRDRQTCIVEYVYNAIKISMDFFLCFLFAISNYKFFLYLIFCKY